MNLNLDAKTQSEEQANPLRESSDFRVKNCLSPASRKHQMRQKSAEQKALSSSSINSSIADSKSDGSSNSKRSLRVAVKGNGLINFDSKAMKMLNDSSEE